MTTERKPHKWQKEIIAWANGEQIQFRDMRTLPVSDWVINTHPSWYTDGTYEYRVKTEPDIIDLYIRLDCGGIQSYRPIAGSHLANVRFSVIDGKVTAVELISK